MLRIPKLILPENMPTSEAIRSCNVSPTNYEPEFWELCYETNRYLKNVPDEFLTERYKNILCNMKMLICHERNVIPIPSYLSSWYWFRKEHQTRMEFSLRSMSLPIEPPYKIIFNNEAAGAPIRPEHPNAGNVLFRYSKKQYLDELANQGKIRICQASVYKDMENDRARQDEELSKKSFLSGSGTRIIMQDGRDIPFHGDIQKTVSASNYYVLCMALDWDVELFNNFQADACIVIKDVNLFANRVETAASQFLLGWHFFHTPVHYFDPYERLQNGLAPFPRTV